MFSMESESLGTYARPPSALSAGEPGNAQCEPAISVHMAVLPVCVIAFAHGVMGSKRRAIAFLLAGAAAFAVVYFVALGCSRYRRSPPQHATLHLHRIWTAMLQYEECHGVLPPAYLCDDNGKPIHSWRVLLLPFLDQKELYSSYNFSQPWDGPNNRRLIETMPEVYSWPENRANDDTTTGYVVVVGEGTAFPGCRSIRAEDILPSARKETIMVVQCADSGIAWTEPRDLFLDEMSFKINDPANVPSIRSQDDAGANVLFVYGTTERLGRDVGPSRLRNLLVIDSSEQKSGNSDANAKPVVGAGLRSRARESPRP